MRLGGAPLAMGAVAAHGGTCAARTGSGCLSVSACTPPRPRCADRHHVQEPAGAARHQLGREEGRACGAGGRQRRRQDHAAAGGRHGWLGRQQTAGGGEVGQAVIKVNAFPCSVSRSAGQTSCVVLPPPLPAPLPFPAPADRAVLRRTAAVCPAAADHHRRADAGQRRGDQGQGGHAYRVPHPGAASLHIHTLLYWALSSRTSPRCGVE